MHKEYNFLEKEPLLTFDPKKDRPCPCCVNGYLTTDFPEGEPVTLSHRKIFFTVNLIFLTCTSCKIVSSDREVLTINKNQVIRAKKKIDNMLRHK